MVSYSTDGVGWVTIMIWNLGIYLYPRYAYCKYEAKKNHINQSSLMTKALHISVESMYSCDSCMVLSLQALDELVFWGANL